MPYPSGLKEVHISDVRTFRQCRRKWGWTSPLRQGLEPNVPYVPFFTGRAVHYCLEMLYGQDIPIAESLLKFVENEIAAMQAIYPLWAREEEALSEQVVLLHSIMDHYDEWRDSRFNQISFRDANLEFIVMEKEFQVPLRDSRNRVRKDWYFAGRFDGIVKHQPTDTYWIFETKTTRSIKELMRSLANDEQCASYILAAEEFFDFPIEGVLYNIIRKKAPVWPGVLASGYMSLAKGDTTAEAFLMAASKYHDTWSRDDILMEYSAHLSALSGIQNAFFARVPIKKSRFELRQLRADLFYTAREMFNRETKLYPAPSWSSCNFCSFRAPCLAMNRGDKASLKILLDEEYRTRIFESEWIKEEGNDSA